MAPTHSHDTGYRLLFSHAEFVSDLIHGFVHDSRIQSLDLSTLEQMPANYVTETFEQRANDVVWRLQVDGKDEWAYLYVMIEFQSGNDNDMALRVMIYTGLLWQHLKKANQIAPGHRYPPVLPIVLYNGAAPWTAPVELADLIVPTEGLLSTLQPNMRYLIIDEARILAKDLPEQNLVSAIIQIEHPPSANAVADILVTLNEMLDRKPTLRRDISIWVRSVFSRSPDRAILLPQAENLKEMGMALHEVLEQKAKLDREAGRQEGLEQGLEQGLEHGLERGLERGLKQGLEQGLERGLQQGLERGLEEGRSAMANALKRLLTKRFGTTSISPAIAERIALAELTQLDVWFARALDASDIKAVFTDG
jgi:Putative transposase, YhgA-like